MKADDGRISRVTPYPAKLYVHHFRGTQPAQFDTEFRFRVTRPDQVDTEFLG